MPVSLLHPAARGANDGAGTVMFPQLGSPVAFGPMELRNRIVCLPHGLNYAEPGTLLPTQRHLEYYESRARGGVGLVCVETSVCSWDGQSSSPSVISSDPRCVPGYQAIARAVHDAGAKISGQITHFGLDAVEAVTRRPVIGPSHLPGPASGMSGRAMTGEDMARVRADFVAAARNIVAAGFDGVELKLAHDGLLRQFMSPLTNARRDEYGGTTENRMRFPLEVAATVSEAIPDHVALGVRLVLAECVPGGYDLDEGIAFGRLLAASGFVDYLSSDLGIGASVAMVVPPMGVAEGYAEQAFSRLSEACSTPVVAFGQIRTPAYAERILVEGKAAAVGLARQMLADPQWASKALAGHPERIRPCTSCNQLCLYESSQRRAVGCTVNPLAGFGEQRQRKAAGQSPQRVVVVGAGPAGLEAARVAAEDGNDVVLIEARDRLGGQLAVAARARGRGRWRAYLDWLEHEIHRLGVTLRLDGHLTAAQIRELAPDRLIVATGSVATPPPAPNGHVVDIEAYLADDRSGGSVVLVDCGAAGPALWTAAYESAHRGAAEVVVVTRLATVAADLDEATTQWLRQQFATLRVRVLTEHAVARFSVDGVVASTIDGESEVELPADLVVTVTPRHSIGADLINELGDAIPLTVIGDALLPRDATAAIREGQEAGAASSA